MSFDLFRYWVTFESPPRYSPLGIGCGITAFDVSDAMALMHRCFPETEKLTVKSIRENIPVSDLDQFHVVPNMGNVAVRGIWFPQL